jgi:predicted RNA methylase
LDKHQGKQSISAANLSPIINNTKNIRTFRIVISNENVPAAIDEKLRCETEKYISRISGLKVNRYLPDTEFWFLYRREENQNSFFVFMKRLTLRASWEKTLHKGELPPPLAWSLCRIAGLVHSDAVLDPFCGYGSIPEAAFKYFHITNFTACDNNREAALFSSSRFSKRKKGEFVIHCTDFENLSSLTAEKSIDVIITDPPWGYFRHAPAQLDESLFLKKMFDVFGKLLKENGRVVVLYKSCDFFIKAVPAGFKLQTCTPILFSGKKAVIYFFIKIML